VDKELLQGQVGQFSNNNNDGGGYGGGGQLKGNCNWCGKPGHMVRDCFSNPELTEYKGDKK